MKSFFMGCQASIMNKISTPSPSLPPSSPSPGAPVPRVHSIPVSEEESTYSDEVAAAFATHSNTNSSRPLSHSHSLTQSHTQSQPQLRTLEASQFFCSGLLGTGGFGRVFAALHKPTGKWYAVKEIRKTEVMKHRSGMQMIYGELDALMRVNHKFVVNLHYTFYNMKCCYFVMDMKTGGDLRFYLKHRRPEGFSELTVAFYTACLSSALEHIHSRNIIHRDIKPENILIDDRGYPYLTDFGVAYLREDTDDFFGDTLTCTLPSGTKQYLAPEVFVKGHVHGPEVDYWSLGVVMYELFFAKRPFEKHCKIDYINYLEQARAKMKDRIHREGIVATYPLSPSFPSTDRDSLSSTKTVSLFEGPSPSQFASPFHAAIYGGGNIVPPPCPGSKSNKFMPTNSTCSPHYSPQYSPQYSPGLSPGGGSPGGMSPGLNSPQRFFTTGRGSPSVAYCTSVGYTQDSLRASPGPGGPYGPSPGPSTGGFQSIATMSPNANTNVNANVGICMGGLQRPRAQVVTPDLMDPAGASGDVTKLPMIRQDLGKPRPSIFPSKKDSPPLSNSLRQSHESLRSSIGSQSLLRESEYETENEMGFAEEHEMDEEQDYWSETPGHFWRLPPGNHWVVDKELSKELVMEIPGKTESPSRQLSSACLEVLRGLFDIRPSHRLGCRNYEQLKGHRWFRAVGLPSWDDLLEKKFVPPHLPSERMLRDTRERINDIARGRLLCDIKGTEDCDKDKEGNTIRLSRADHKQFEGLYYISPEHDRNFVPPPRPVIVVKESESEKEKAKRDREREERKNRTMSPSRMRRLPEYVENTRKKMEEMQF